MKKPYIIYADLHLYSPIEILRKEVLAQPYRENVKFLADIFDLANVAHKDLKQAEKEYASFKKKHGKNYINGNHERMTIVNELIIENGIVFAHGDMESNPEKWTEYRQKPHGAGWFKRKFIIPFIREAEEIINRKPKREFLDNAASLAKYHKCHTYVCGHFHSKNVIDLQYKDVRIVILPRGRTEISL